MNNKLRTMWDGMHTVVARNAIRMATGWS